MASQTGRTVEKHIYVIIGDAANVLREVAVDSIGDVGVTFDPTDVSAWQDAVKNILSGQGAAKIKIGGPWDTAAVATAPVSGEAHALSGSHTVLEALNGDNLPHTLDIRFGVRHPWETGEPHFGLQRATATNSGYTVHNFTVSGHKYTCDLDVMGSVAPAWSTGPAFTAGS